MRNGVWNMGIDALWGRTNAVIPRVTCFGFLVELFRAVRVMSEGIYRRKGVLDDVEPKHPLGKHSCNSAHELAPLYEFHATTH